MLSEFDSVWHETPHISLAQVRLLLSTSFIGFIGGCWTLLPMFILNKPDIQYKCKSNYSSEFDQLLDIEWGKCEMKSTTLLDQCNFDTGKCLEYYVSNSYIIPVKLYQSISRLSK